MHHQAEDGAVQSPGRARQEGLDMYISEGFLTPFHSAGLLGLLCSVTVTCQQVDPSLTGQALLNMQTGPRRPLDFEEVMVSPLMQF